jgi:hypothetical protein
MHPEQCADHCVVDISGNAINGRDPREILQKALLRCNTTVRLGPNVRLNFPRDTFRPLRFGRCITLTSVDDFNRPTSLARTPRNLGPALNYTEPDALESGTAKTFLQIQCPENGQPSDHIRISGFRLLGPTQDYQSHSDVGIRIRRCVDIEISNMEIAGWGASGIAVENKPKEHPHRIKDYSQVRIHDNFIHHNQHPSYEGSALGYGVEVSDFGPRAHIYRNVFDFNRHAIAADGETGGYIAEENLVLKGGGWHGRTGARYTHIFDVHGTGCWWDDDLCGNAGEEFHYVRNSFQYSMDNAISIRGQPSEEWTDITENVFPHSTLVRCCGLDAYFNDMIFSKAAILLGSAETVIWSGNVTKTDTFGDYYSQCDFDDDGIDDLFLATGATWWFSSSGKLHWSFLNTSSKRRKDLKFGYFDDDDRCDVLTESGGIGRWLISSGGTGPWKPLEQVWHPVPWHDKMWAPLKEVEFGRFNPKDLSAAQPLRTTHAFHRATNGAWHVKKLSDPTSQWENVGGSSKPMRELRFGDFTGDGVTDVLAVNEGRWAISSSARERWRPLNRYLADAVADLFIANMDVNREGRQDDDKIDDILRLEVQSEKLGQGIEDVELTWWRSRNGIDQWREFRKYRFRYLGNSTHQHGLGFVYPRYGFVGRLGRASGGTLVIDPKRFGHVFSPGSFQVWTSLFPY